MKRSIAAIVVGAVFALSVLWLAGEQHRANCIERARACSMLPWDHGKKVNRPAQRVILDRQLNPYNTFDE